jgi:hypothetical protein
MPRASPLYSPRPHSSVGISFNIFMTFNGNFEFIASEYYEMTVSMNVSKSLAHVSRDLLFILGCEDFAWNLFTRSISDLHLNCNS